MPIFGRPGREGLWLGAKMRRMDRENDNPHDEHLRFGWMTVRYGIKHVSEDGEKLGRVLDWIEETKSSVPDPRFLKAWEAISSGAPQSEADAISGTDYWMVGAYWDSADPQDQTQRFLDEGVWENGYEDRYRRPAMRVRDCCSRSHSKAKSQSPGHRLS